MATKKKTVKGKKAVGKTVKSGKSKSGKTTAKKKIAKPVKKPIAKKPLVKKAPSKKPAKSTPLVKKTVATSAVKTIKKPVAASQSAKNAPVKNVYVKPLAPKPPSNIKNIAAHSKDKSAKNMTPIPVKKPVALKPVAQRTEAIIPPPRPIRPVMPAPPPHKPVPVKVAVTPIQRNSNGTEKTRYADAELKEFKILVDNKLKDARTELINLNAAIISANENGTDDTGASFKMLEDGSDTLAKEEAAQLAAKQKKFIEQLEAALVRIENKTYGICRVTGKLIPKERLRAVPHTTQSMEAKLKQYKE